MGRIQRESKEGERREVSETVAAGSLDTRGASCFETLQNVTLEYYLFIHLFNKIPKLKHELKLSQ